MHKLLWASCSLQGFLRGFWQWLQATPTRREHQLLDGSLCRGCQRRGVDVLFVCRLLQKRALGMWRTEPAPTPVITASQQPSSGRRSRKASAQGVVATTAPTAAQARRRTASLACAPP